MSEQKKILEMIESGQITAEEGMELLNAINKSESDQKNYAIPYETVNKNYKYLKVKVSSDNNSVKVNVSIPIRLLMILGGIAGKITTMIPKDAQSQMEKNGIDIQNINFVEIIEELLNGTLEDPSIIDVESWDEEHNTMVRVKIYAE